MGRPLGSGLPAPDRFWPKVDKSGECWLWTGSLQKNGYGRFCVTTGDVRFAHRYGYELQVGPIPEGMTLDHLCATKSCVRGSHLEPVSRSDNVRRHFAKQDTCVNGHSLADALKHHGRRECRTCNRIRCAARAAR